MSEKHLLITGGTGFLGKALAKEFVREGHKVTLFDLVPLDDAILAKQVEVVLGDVRDLDQLRQGSQGCQVVIHAAASLPILGSRQLIWDVNVKGTENVLTIAMEQEVEKVIYLSSTAVYGVPKTHPISETDPLKPIGYYGISKAESEKLCEEFRRRGVSVTVLRPKTFLGPGRMGVFQILFEWVLQGDLIYLIGNGANRYQLLALSDLIRVIEIVVNKPGFSETINLGAEHFGTVREDLEELISCAQSRSVLFPLPAVPIKGFLRVLELLGLSPLAEWHYRTACEDSFVSLEKAKRLLGWAPQKSNAEALIESYNEYNKNRSVYLARKGVTHSTCWDPKLLKLFQIPARWTKWLRN